MLGVSSYRIKKILLADNKLQRRKSIESTLKELWKAKVFSVTNLQEAENAQENIESFDVILVAFGFGGNPFSEIFWRFNKAGQRKVLIDNKPDRTLPQMIDSLLVIPENITKRDLRLTENLSPIMGARPPKLPIISNTSRWNDLLRIQIRELDPKGDLSKGKEIICHLIHQILPDIERFNLYSIRQGFSGACVFRISYRWPKNSTKQIERVLKLTPNNEQQVWKCIHEVESYPKIRDSLGGNVLALIPEIHAINTGEELLPAQYKDWLSVMYTFLKNKRYIFADFEKVFIDPQEFEQKNLAKSFLENLINTLSNWYKPNIFIKSLPLWSVEEAREDKPLSFPPYSFKHREKKRIIQSIHSIDEYGLSFKTIPWTKYRDLVRSCLPRQGKVGKSLHTLCERHRVLCGTVHGDMNANNILMAIDYGIPYLIDFACYQSCGHLLQDLARLEVAIKIQLMGREKGKSPVGHDLNINMLSEWCKAEDWLSSWPKDDFKYPDNNKEDSTMRAYLLCKYVRLRAQQIYKELLSSFRNKPNFKLTYNVALLYHTVRAIGYDSLPHLKRIFATYCAGKIIEHL